MESDSYIPELYGWESSCLRASRKLCAERGKRLRAAEAEIQALRERVEELERDGRLGETERARVADPSH